MTYFSRLIRVSSGIFLSRRERKGMKEHEGSVGIEMIKLKGIFDRDLDI